ncbi:MAG: type II CAAX prenyl endopeptidase Rce1 family protein [Halobacteriales archaeon]
MATPRWRLFAGVTLVVLVTVLALSRATAEALSGEDTPEADPGHRTGTRGPVAPPDTPATDERGAEEREHPVARSRRAPSTDPGSDLLVSAALSQALVGGLLVGLAWYAQVPARALGLAAPGNALLPGLALGVALYGANEGGVWIADRFGIESDEALRELLAPETARGWIVLLFVVLPLVAVVEELLFRGALVGALAAGFPVSPWPLAVLSSVAFGLGHGLQGLGGVVVTGALGFALAAAFVLTGSLWVVVVAHYVVNALEFLVHEGPPAGLEHRR